MSWKDKDTKDQPPAAGGTYGLTAEPHDPLVVKQPWELQGAGGVGPQGAPGTPGAYPGSFGYAEGPANQPPSVDLRPAPPLWFQTWRIHTHVPLGDQEVADLMDYVGKLETAGRTLLNRLSAGVGTGPVGSI